MKKRIIFTGGGSAGHVSVNLALIPKFIDTGWEVFYIGSENGIEKQLVSDLKREVKYYSVSTGKLRRYFDWNNFKDPFRVMKGSIQAYKLIKMLKPNLIFSKGGFVSVPVVIGGWLNKTPVIIHESDITPGLANRISTPFATKVFTTFSETDINSDKSVHIGAVVREELLQGNPTKGLYYCNFTKEKPVILIIGGSLGANRINHAIRANLDTLINHFQIVHICGKGNLDTSYNIKGYNQYEYINQELPDIMAMSNIVISRAGSNSIFEFLALRKPMLLIPLSRKASRGDQILNAKSFEENGYCEVLFEEDLTEESLLNGIFKVYKNRSKYIENMLKDRDKDSLRRIIDLINKLAK